MQRITQWMSRKSLTLCPAFACMTSVGQEQRARRRKIGSADEVFRTVPTLARVSDPYGSHPFVNPGAWRRATTNARQDGQAELRGSVGRPEARGRSRPKPSGAPRRRKCRAAQTAATSRSTESVNEGADRRVCFGAPTEVAGSAQFGVDGAGSTEPAADTADRCRRALMAIQALERADGQVRVVRTRPRQAESRVDDRSTDRTRPEWSVAEDPEKLTGASRKVTRGLSAFSAETVSPRSTDIAGRAPIRSFASSTTPRSIDTGAMVTELDAAPSASATATSRARWRSRGARRDRPPARRRAGADRRCRTSRPSNVRCHGRPPARAMTPSSSSRPSCRRSSRPSATWVARSRIDSILARESPAARRASSPVAHDPSGAALPGVTVTVTSLERRTADVG